MYLCWWLKGSFSFSFSWYIDLIDYIGSTAKAKETCHLSYHQSSWSMRPLPELPKQKLEEGDHKLSRTFLAYLVTTTEISWHLLDSMNEHVDWEPKHEQVVSGDWYEKTYYRYGRLYLPLRLLCNALQACYTRRAEMMQSQALVEQLLTSQG